MPACQQVYTNEDPPSQELHHAYDRERRSSRSSHDEYPPFAGRGPDLELIAYFNVYWAFSYLLCQACQAIEL